MTNMEYIMSKMDVRAMARMMYDGFDRGLADNGSLGHKIKAAFSRWADRNYQGKNRGNMYNYTDKKTGEVYDMPNPLSWDRVHDYTDGEPKEDENGWVHEKWIRFGHGPYISRQMFLEAQYNPEDWA